MTHREIGRSKPRAIRSMTPRAQGVDAAHRAALADRIWTLKTNATVYDVTSRSPNVSPRRYTRSTGS